MLVIRVINLSNARLQIDVDDFIEPKAIRDFPLDISDNIKKQLVSYANMKLAKVFEINIKEKAIPVVEPNVEDEVLDTEAKPKQIRKNKKK